MQECEQHGVLMLNSSSGMRPACLPHADILPHLSLRLAPGVSYQGSPLVNPGSGQPMYFGAPGSQGQPTTFTPSPGPSLLPDRPLNLLGSIKGRPVRNDASSSPAYLGGGDGSRPPEQYLAYDPADLGSTKPIPPGSPVVLKNKVRHVSHTLRLALCISRFWSHTSGLALLVSRVWSRACNAHCLELCPGCGSEHSAGSELKA